MSKIKLGQTSTYPDTYDASLLQPIARQLNRQQLFAAELPFTGEDVWTAYEVSWLNNFGKPVVAIFEFVFPCLSENIVESKSFKFYLNSFNQTSFSDIEDVVTQMQRDLSRAAGIEVEIKHYAVDEYSTPVDVSGRCIDHHNVHIDQYAINSSLLSTHQQAVEKEVLYSHLLKSNCPETGQPDWATIWIEYSGHKIDQSALLMYIVSYRQHQDFHENCVERIFNDLLLKCQPTGLSIYARYTRRGGLDINPFRTNCGRCRPNFRSTRQ